MRKNFTFYFTWITGLFSVLLWTILAAQCGAPPTPPLPTAPTGPVLSIALLSPTSGESATFGRMMRNGSIMAFDEWNNRGGVLGRRLEWTVYDADCSFESGRLAAQKAVTDGHRLLIGPLCSEAAIGAATVADAEQILLMAPTATHPLVTVDGEGRTRPTVFRASYGPTWQAQMMARFAVESLKVKRAALLANPRDDYAVSLAAAFTQELSARGGDIAYRGEPPAADADLAQMLLTIAQTGAGVIYLPADPATANRVADQLNTLGLVKSPENPSGLSLLGSDSWESPQLDLTAVNGSYFPTHFALSNAQTWAKTYKATYAVEPTTLAALGYDAAGLLIAAVDRAGAVDPAAVAEALDQGQFNGATGPISFDAGHNPRKPAPIVYIDQGRMTFFTLFIP